MTDRPAEKDDEQTIEEDASAEADQPHVHVPGIR